MTEETKNRIRVLALEGVPGSWIAEDVGVDRWTVRRLIRKEGWAKAPEQWPEVWAQIRPQPKLRHLHSLFTPR